MFPIRLCRHLKAFKMMTLPCTQRAQKSLQSTAAQNDSEHFNLRPDLKDLIIYNSYLESQKLHLGWKRNKIRELKMQRLEYEERMKEAISKPEVSLAFKYLSPESKSKLFEEANVKNENLLNNKESAEHGVADEEQKITANVIATPIPDFLDLMDSDDENLILDLMEIGSFDPRVPASKVPCGGCGAMLHCKSKHEPGFVPKELFHGVPEKHLRAMICQRCYYLKHYTKALKVNVSPDDYPEILSQIRHKRALILLVIDLMDFPCSIWPDLCNIVGSKRPVCVVGNKVDLLPKDSKNYLANVTSLLRSEVQRVTGISDIDLKHVALVSARTGYGIEELITKLQNSWSNKGDIYLIGCTNVGKSSLFNTLLHSDLCKVNAVDLVQKATISHWPGTTLNLLKFPILRPGGAVLATRTKRLIAERNSRSAEQTLRKEELRKTRKLEHATLQAHVGKSFTIKREESADPFSQSVKPVVDFEPGVGLNPKDPLFKDGKWFYDTPGTINHDQVLNLLTDEELLLVLPKGIISPQTFRIKPRQTLYLAGLGRLDYIDGETPIMFTVFASKELPITICNTENADELYSELLGTDMFGVPFRTEERLSKWPGLKCGSLITLNGVGWKESCADILLSSTGWVSVTMGNGMQSTFQAHTPEARGIHVRIPPILPFAVYRRGKKIRDSPAYHKYIPFL